MPRRSAPDDRAGTERLGPALVRWFREHRRPLPWRTDRDPYRTWVAEVFLQQTRVDQARPFFERFVRRFPNVRRLARARRGEVLKLWQGAGYYARARRLQAAARVLVARHGGELPGSVDELEQLPGIGPYTARAIAALAFGASVVPVDANGLRVAARWTREERDLHRPAVRSSLTASLERLAPRGEAGEFAEAVMELGETVCLPRAPRCPSCPAAFACRARQELDDPGRLPRLAPRPTRPHLRASVVALARGDRWLVQQRPPSGLLGGLWEFPGGKVEPGESPEAAARRELREETGAVVARLEPVTTVRHGYSHFTVELHLFRGVAPRALALDGGRRWATLEEIARLPLPRATEKILEALRSGGARVRPSRPARGTSRAAPGGRPRRAPSR